MALRLGCGLGAVLKAKLRKQRQVCRHFFPLLEDYVCGPSTQLEIQSGVQQATIQALARQLGEAAEGDHAEVRKLWQEGHPHEALNRVRALKAESLTWAVLPPVTKAKLLRLEGRLVLTAGDVTTAKGLAAEADRFDSSGGGRLIAMIAQAEGRLADAIAVLSDDSDPDSQALKGAVEIEGGQIDAALKTLSPLVDHPDAHRLRSLVLLSRGEHLQAKAEAAKALALAPSWYWMRRTAATVRYLASLAPIAVPNALPEWPEPINPVWCDRMMRA